MRTIFLIFFLFFFLESVAQKIFFRQYNLEEGLPQSEVHAITQDSRGYLWLGTKGGLSYFNGKKIQTLPHDSLADRVVESLLFDFYDRLWIGTPSGLLVYDGLKFERFGTPYFENNTHFDLEKSPSGKVWILAHQLLQNNQLWCYEDKKLVNFSQKYPQIKQPQHILVSQQHNRLLIFTKDKIWTLENDKLKESPLSSFTEIQGKNVVPILEDSKGRIWLMVGQQEDRKILIWNRFSFEILQTPPDLPLNRSIQILEQKNGSFVMAVAGKGLYFLKDKQYTFLGEEHGLPNSSILKVFEDSEENLWLGTSGGGLLLYQTDAFEIFDRSTGLNFDAVASIFEDSENRVWISSMNGDLSFFDGQKLVQQFKSKGSIGKIKQICEYKEHLLLLTQDGLLRYDYQTFSKANPLFNLPENALPTAVLQDGTTWWFGTQNGLYKFEEGICQKISFQKHIPDASPIECLYLDQQNQVWVITKRAVLRYDGENFYKIATPDQKNHFLDISQDHAGSIWLVNFMTGVQKVYKDKIIRTFNESSLLSSNLVYSIANDKFGNIWVGTQKGADQLILDKNGNPLKSKHYGNESGFVGIESTPASTLLDSKGYLWFGTIQGAMRYMPKQKSEDGDFIRLYIQNVRLFFQDVDWFDKVYRPFFSTWENWYKTPQGLELPYRFNHVSFDFEAVNFSAPQRVRYSWRLEGVDADWSPLSDQTEATYPSLDAGDYVFQVRAFTQTGVRLVDTVSYKFSINQPFWQTLWFWLTVVMMLIFVIYQQIRMRAKNEEIRQKKLEGLIVEKTLEVMMQKNALEYQNLKLQKLYNQITDSLRYAQRIQSALLGNTKNLKRHFGESFVFFKPKDIVSGDFFWFSFLDNYQIIVAADCTGHGVSGAFMTVMGINFLDDIINNQHVYEPHRILEELDQKVLTAVRKDEAKKIGDGMDIGILVFDNSQQKVWYAGAKRPLFIARSNKELETVRGDKFPIGGVHYTEKQFSSIEVNYEKGDTFYLTSDGFADQFGGKEGGKYLTKNFRNYLQKIARLSAAQQHQRLEEEYQLWKGNHAQTDDVLIIGLKV